jgi:hypothetical protein
MNKGRDDEYPRRSGSSSGNDEFDSELLNYQDDNDQDVEGDIDASQVEYQQSAYHVYGTYETEDPDVVDPDAETDPQFGYVDPSSPSDDAPYRSDTQAWYGPSSDPIWNASISDSAPRTRPSSPATYSTDTQQMRAVHDDDNRYSDQYEEPRDATRMNAPFPYEDTAQNTSYPSSTPLYTPPVTDTGYSELDAPPTTPQVEPPRRSRARDRVRRRKMSQGQTVTPPILAREGARAIPRAIASSARPSQVRAGRERVPRVDLSALPLNYMRFGIYAIGAVALVIGVIVLLSLFANDTPPAGNNAIWIGTEWTYDTRTDADVEALVARLRQNEIGTVYAWVSWIPASGQWSGSGDGTRPFSEREASVVRFVNQFKQAYPEARLFSWLGIPTEDAATGIPYRLNDTTFRENVAEFSAYTINDLGFDGVYLNAEPVWDRYGEDFIQLINTVRLEIGQGAEIAIPVHPDWTPVDAPIPQPRSIVPGTVLSPELKERLMLITDQIAVMAYNSGLTSPFDYSAWFAYQVDTYAKAAESLGGGGVEVLIGVPTYPNELPGHDANVENMFTALNGLRQGLEQAGSASRFITGAAIYGGWETDDTEWLQFQQGWVTR